MLEVFDSTLRAGLSKVLNVDLNDDQWFQASLPVGEGGLGIRIAQMVAPSAFLSSAASTSALQQSILPDSVSLLEDQSVTFTETRWSSLSGSTRPANEELYIHKAWDKPVTKITKPWSSQEQLVTLTKPGSWLLHPPFGRLAVCTTHDDEIAYFTVR